MPSPRNSQDTSLSLEVIRSLFANRLDCPCLIVGNGPSANAVSISSEELEACVIFRMNWFFLEQEARFGSRVDGFFCSIQNDGLEERLEEIVRQGDYTIRAFFQPFISTYRATSQAKPSALLQPHFDHWSVIASHPTLARFMMGRPLPTQGMQVLAFAAALGFKDIRLAGIDMYAAAARRYAWDIPADVRSHLQRKDVEGGYETRHSLDVDLMFLRAVRGCYNFTLTGLGPLERLKPYLDHALPPISKRRPTTQICATPAKYAYATFAEGDYVLGVIALARSLAKVSEIPLVVMYSDPAVRVQLAHLPNVILRKISPIPNPHAYGQARFNATYSKLRVFELCEFDRVVFVDADAIFLRSTDELFDGEGFQAAPNWGFELKQDFNSGVFAFTPSAELAHRVISGIHTYPSEDGGDQGYLNALFKHEWHPLPPEFNTLKRVLVYHPALISLSDVRILHFVGSKPWRLVGDSHEYDYLNTYWSEQLSLDDWKIFYNINRISHRAGKRRAPHTNFLSSLRWRMLSIGKYFAPRSTHRYIKTILRKVGLY